MERIQNDLFRALHQYKDEHQMNQTQLAKQLKFSKGYISQVLNGDFNFSLKKLIELSLAVGVVPDIDFKHLQDFIDQEEIRLNRLDQFGFARVENLNPKSTYFVDIDSPEEPSKLVG